MRKNAAQTTKWRNNMKKLLPILFAAYVTIGQNSNFQLGNGYSYAFEVDQPLVGKLSLNPSVFMDNNTGFKDRSANVDLNWEATKVLTFMMGAGYDKYTLTGVEPTEDNNVHTAVKVKVW
jgi:Type IX secretion system membrane protein PorP/SprF